MECKAMSLNEADFIACEFSVKSPSSKSLVRWLKPGEVVVSVQLPGRGAQSAAMRARKWQGFPADAEGVQRKLGTFGDLTLGGLHDYMLYLKRGGKKVATLLWAADTESKQLAELRGLLERVAHLAGAEAMQYWDEGHQLGQHKLHAKAMEALQTGTKILGDRYRAPGLRDDTGSLLVFAAQNENV